MKSNYVIFSEGCYSDYQGRAFAVLKPFTMNEVAPLFRSQWMQDGDGPTEPGASEFIAWMNKEGYIRDADEIPEIHLGSYYEFEPEKIGLDLMKHEFDPGEKNETT